MCDHIGRVGPTEEVDMSDPVGSSGGEGDFEDPSRVC